MSVRRPLLTAALVVTANSRHNLSANGGEAHELPDALQALDATTVLLRGCAPRHDAAQGRQDGAALRPVGPELVEHLGRRAEHRACRAGDRCRSFAEVR